MANSFKNSPKYLLTSESVTEGHPDKLCDQISDAILDAIMKDDPYGRVACETAVTTGLVIVLGCAHRGIINTIRHAREITGEETVHTVIGGTHLYPKNEAQVERTISALKEIGVQNIGVSHCTGLTAAMKLKAAFGDRFFFNNAGNVRVIE